MPESNRTEKQIRAELTDARAAHHQMSAGINETEHRASSGHVKVLMAELSAMLSAGAASCPACDAGQPHGRHKGKGEFRVLCLGCGRQARGESREEAASNWNAGELFVPQAESVPAAAPAGM